MYNRPPDFYWDRHQRYFINNRLAWYAEEPDEAFWHEYWKARVDADVYSRIEAESLESNLLGQRLASELSATGVHLEAGCGAGFWVARLQSNGYQVEGIEYSRDLVKLVNKVNPKLPVYFGNAMHLDCPDNHYDSYLSFGVVEHQIEGPEPFLLEAVRVLKRGGKIVISVPFMGPVRSLKHYLNLYLDQEPNSHFFQYAFSKKEFLNLLESAGFIIKASFPLHVHRLLIEEVKLYRILSYQHGGKLVRLVAAGLLQRIDGHMLVVVGEKN